MGNAAIVIADAEWTLLTEYMAVTKELMAKGNTVMSKDELKTAVFQKVTVVAKDLTLLESIPDGNIALSDIVDRLDTAITSLKNREVTITGLNAREIIDSRGNPTVEVDVLTTTGMYRASVPSGASTGIYEACELRDGGNRYVGKGVIQAVNNIRATIAPALMGKDPRNQEEIDQLMLDLDGTSNKTNLGANAILGVSLAVAKAGAGAKGMPLYRHFADLAGNDQLILPVPSFNVINGGSHAGNKLAFQEFMIMPVGASSFREAMQMGAEVYHQLKKVIKERYGQDATNVGDEGGFAPNIQNNREGVELLMEARQRSGYGDKVVFAMDVAASEFKVDNGYDLDFKTKGNNGSQVISGDTLKDMFKDLANEFPIVSIEDPFDQDDWESYTKITAEIGDRTQIVGDDLLVTNPTRISEAADKSACNALLLKVNQIGSVTEAIRAVKLAKGHGWGIMTSHRSGETEDCYIADLAVGLCTGQIKTGAPCRSERLAKYNQLLRIEEELGDKAVYAGSTFRRPAWMG
uniref:phosphopyruvate hydratase n=1 Tax=Heterosigma akashiwo TaxID=2829 RepID=A0A6V1RTS7_HETAK|mmetsp:Transcript_35266/g.55419  ORF Transcript_35266/g.55419 Transcript_35266/m.55419 type:complete len:521 (-) Transcript_35266:234-1796(-)|eukprot:CAMPEP_0206397344 /NCGR_PEP_ID=MMETSP0294-20121207/23400_1 /ASSEMBLY_ACC=CAM_ASM_000327 /TAXON_ID=39354 /ORGANISM="Heterosigma akashiwo, Strain CCMP2393" /LENGTH=520 /DNA_ID=CAMNT_0053852399 /DNA_START=366 /DNA_END=1928 /DNA_ORIENTATION=+